MYTLIGSPKTRAFRVLWMLEEIGADYEIKSVGPRDSLVSGVNPTGKIPVLLDEDEPIIDSVAIIQYLADKHNDATFQAGTLDRARQDSFTQFACDEFDANLWCAARNTFILPEEKRAPEIKETLRWELERSIEALAQRLGDNTYLMGDTFTVPDILLTHCGSWARNTGIDFGDGPVDAYFNRVLARPAYKRAHKIRAAG